MPLRPDPARSGPAPPARVPVTMRRNVVQAWGADGERWLAELPRLVAELAGQWGLQVGGLAGPISFHWVVTATTQQGEPVVLKVGPPGLGHLAVEAAALQAFGGHGAVRVLRHDVDRGALLLERARPGVPVTRLVDDADELATAAIIDVARRLHLADAAGCGLPSLEGYRAAFEDHLAAGRGGDVLPRPWVVRAAALFDELCANAERSVVLHGDLHHDNVLSATREPWLAIDPHGVVGDPGFEVGAALYNPWPQRRDPRLLATLSQRVEQFADGLGLPHERVVAWGFVMAVLSEVWTCEGGGTAGSRALDVAEHLLPRLP